MFRKPEKAHVCDRACRADAARDEARRRLLSYGWRLA
jgi:hypothetical protein